MEKDISLDYKLSEVETSCDTNSLSKYLHLNLNTTTWLCAKLETWQILFRVLCAASLLTLHNVIKCSESYRSVNTNNEQSLPTCLLFKIETLWLFTNCRWEAEMHGELEAVYNRIEKLSGFVERCGSLAKPWGLLRSKILFQKHCENVYWEIKSLTLNDAMRGSAFPDEASYVAEVSL